MMQKSKIEWTDFVWNPIRGLCPVNCKTPDGKEYCYARRMYQRFGWNPKIRIAEEYPGMIFMPLYGRKKEIISRKVFVCSTFELFHPSVKKEWRNWIFDNIEYNSNLTFQILTKFPQNIDRPMPDNVWLGTTVTQEESNEVSRIFKLKKAKAIIKFISFEPMLSDFHYDLSDSKIDWVIIGRLTQYGHKHDPKLEWIKKIVRECADYGIKVFLKDNLNEIWGEPLIQEFPNM